MNAPSAPPDVACGRLSLAEYARNFADAHPPLSAVQARLEAERCYYCHGAPCTTACPTGIDIPAFIARIAQGNLRGAARTILEANVLGGMCARVCPTEVLCEQACVRKAQENKPVEIGLLQRHATDAFMARPQPPLFARAPASGKRIAVVGAGPAGLACAHRLAVLGHAVTLFEARPRLGGLNEYGLATYKTVDGFAQKESRRLNASLPRTRLSIFSGSDVWGVGAVRELPEEARRIGTAAWGDSRIAPTPGENRQSRRRESTRGHDACWPAFLGKVHGLASLNSKLSTDDSQILSLASATINPARPASPPQGSSAFPPIAPPRSPGRIVR